MKVERKDNMPLAARQEVEALGAALYDSIQNGNVEAATGELLYQQTKEAWSGYSSGEPGAQQRYHELIRIRNRMMGFLAYCHLFLEDVQTLTGTSLSKGVSCE